MAVEIDGISHDSDAAIRKDQQRQIEIEALGITFLRFSDEQIKHELEGVLIHLHTWITSNALKPTPNPSQEGNFIAKNKYHPLTPRT